MQVGGLAALLLGHAEARVRLGELLPPHPWANAEREVVVLYTHDCGDLGRLWPAVAQGGLPVRAVNVQLAAGDPTPAPPAGLNFAGGLTLWRGAEANQFAHALKVGVYPAVLLVRKGRILNAWEGDYAGQGLGR